MFFICTLWSFVNFLVLGSTGNRGPRMSSLYSDDFIFKFEYIYTYISLSPICQSGYKLLVLSRLFCGCQRLLLPALTYQWFHLLAYRRPQPSSRDSIYSVSGLCFSDINIFYEFSAFIQTLDLAVWTLRFNKNLPQPEWMCCGKLLGTLPSPVLTIT